MSVAGEQQLAKLLELRRPFEEAQIGLLPRVTCPDCSDKRKKCENKSHIRKRCPECNATVSPKHIHIDFVGHANVTKRLLEVDPLWTWEPFALDENGLPQVDTDNFGNPVGMWIRLTVCGHTRPGYGSVPSNQHDAIKVLIGDAIRNAAQRFGVALEQWITGEREIPEAENAVHDPGRRAMPAKQRAADAAVVVDSEWVAEFEKRLGEAPLEQVGAFRQDVIDAMKTQRINSDTANRLLAAVKQRTEALESVTATGLPANKDGSVSRSKLSDEELAANGLMTKQQVKDHNKMVKDTIANPKLAERSNGVDAEDERWMKGGAKS
ncbi:hypothetical protein [Nonomuraea sp. NPDC049400]|uniref:hypothetical protein n=1 Tax=Nonomuraea sp. NPDC049400 TaxID=3364352 RepID=UPI0037A63F68